MTTKRTYLVHDKGLYPHISDALSDGGKHIVKYHTPYETRDPHYKDYVIGKGFGNLEKVLYPEDYYEKADCIVFFDVSGNSLCNFLRKIYPNKSIWGSGLGERLENDRVLLKEWCAELGLDVNKYVVIKGVDKLREHLKTNKDKYVKVNIFRGDMESFHSPDYDSIESVLDELAVTLGSDKNDYDFIVEDKIDTEIEVGADVIFNGTEFLSPMFCGYELHKNLYVAHVTDKLPKPLQETLDAFTPLLTKMQYRGAFSTEEKVVSSKEHYFIDACMRLPNPLSALYPVAIKNWADVVYQVGLGNKVDLDIRHKYVGAFGLTSLAAKDSYVKINIKKGYEDKVRYQMVTGRGDKNYAVPGWEVVAILVAGGNSVDEVLEGLRKASEGVDAHFLDKDPLEGIDMIKSIIKKGESVGIPFK
jgi:hypothetical protein